MFQERFLLFIDESGDHNLSKVDVNYPIFSLGGLCISETAYKKLSEIVDSLKIKYYGADDVILHSSELKRPKDRRSDPRNIFLLDPSKRADFYSELDKTIIESQDFSLAACFIHKQLHVDYYSQPADPYHFSFENIINRALWHIGDANIEIVAEKRGPELDAALYAEYERLRAVGTKFHSREKINSQTSLVCAGKSENINGLQIIDLILSALTRHHLGKTKKMVGNDLTPQRIEQKYMSQSPTFFPKVRK
jgi:hypothetical protein